MPTKTPRTGRPPKHGSKMVRCWVPEHLVEEFETWLREHLTFSKD